MLWRVNFTVDTGYDWLERVCIVQADTKEQAEEKFRAWIEPYMTGEKYVIKYEVVENKQDLKGIVYQNYTN